MQGDFCVHITHTIHVGDGRRLRPSPRVTKDRVVSAKVCKTSFADTTYYPMGHHMPHIGNATSYSACGFPSKLARYRAEHCSTQCPLRGLCTKARYGAKVITVNHELNRLKKQARANLLSSEGRRQRGQRCIEPEAVFGQINFNKGYTRFRHYTKDKVNMDFGLFAIAFNLQKYARKIDS